MDSQELTIGRSFGIRFDRGEDLFESLRTFCAEREQGYVPMFLAALSEVGPRSCAAGSTRRSTTFPS
jgi:predicted DNA-binding protein with PD1-like motif